MFFIHHFGAFVSVFLLVLLAVGTLMHWDVTGEPIHDLFHRPESVGVRYRFAVWGLALASALSLVASMFGTLGRQWYDGDGTFRLSYRTALAVQMVVGLTVFALGIVMWAQGEVKSPASSPVYMIGSMVGGAAFFAISAAYMGASEVPTLTSYLVWAPISALLLMSFSVANAVTAEPQSVAPPRHHNQLLSGLVGVWGQIFTVVSIVSASRWRFFLHMETPVPVRK